MLRKVLIGLAGALLAVAASPSTAAATPAPSSVALAATTPCVAGMAGPYPCRNIDLQANLPLASMGGGAGSGGWGWTDTTTGREYAVVGRSNGTAFVDVTTPASPVYLGNLPSATGTSSWRELNVYNNTAYIVSDNNGAHGMQVFDLTRLRSVTSPPVTFTADARDTSFTEAHTIAINDDTGFAYVNGSNTCSGGSRMFNLANRLAPAFAGCVAGDGYTHDAQAVVYHGPDSRFTGHEILFASNEDTITVWDVTSKASAVQLSRTGYTGRGYAHQGALTEDHRYFLLDDETDETSFAHPTWTRVFNYTSLTAPVQLATFVGPTNATDHNQFIKAGFAYQSNYKAGLRIINLANIASPATITEDAYFDIFPSANSAGFNGTWTNYPYYPSGNVAVFTIEGGLFVLTPNLVAGPPPTTVYSDTFETAAGWTVNPTGTDTATTGAWERGDPAATSSAGTSLQQGTTLSGVNDLVTGRLAGSSAGANDIDGGTTTIRSPSITLPATGTLTLSFSWYLAHLNNASSADFFRVRIIAPGGTATVFEQLASAGTRAGTWGTATANLTGYAGQQIQIQIEAADAAGASLVEAGVDDAKILQQS